MLETLLDSKEWQDAFVPWLNSQIEKNEKIGSLKGNNENEIYHNYRLQKSKVDVYKNIPNAIRNVIAEAKIIKEADKEDDNG